MMKMRAALITFGSVLLTSAVIGNAYYQKNQFYPSVVYITKSNPSMAIIYLQAFVFVLLMGKLMRKIFFGQLRTAEMEHLIERSWYAVTETCLAFTVFRDDLSPKFVALFTLLLFLKCFHWLGEDRVDYMERSPNISLLFHIRVVSLLTLLGALDFIFVHIAYHSTLTKGASVQLVFGFEYAILFAVVLNILMKYALHFIDLQNDNPWEDKAVYLLYTELLMGFLKVILYLAFITIMMKIHTFPLFAIRPMYLSMRAFKKALNDVIMSRRAIRNMNTLYPDATPEELASVDNVCIICREEMTGNGGAKKLPCNHIFHVSCLRSWFQRQQTCPTCRMDVLRVQNPFTDNIRQQQQPPQQQPQQPQQQQPAMGARFQAQFVIPPNWQPFFAMPNFPQNLQQQQQQNQQPQQQQQNQQGAANNNNNNNVLNNNNNQAPNNNNAATGGQPNLQIPPFLSIPPFLPMFGAPPMPTPPADLSGLTTEELQAMEGTERAHLENRIRCLRNVQTLLDAAVIQLQQYSSVVARLPQPAASADDSSNQTAANQSGASQTGESSSTQPTTSRSTNSSENASPNSTDQQEVLRQRRLQRFSQTQPPVIDSNESVIESQASGSTAESTENRNKKDKSS